MPPFPNPIFCDGGRVYAANGIIADAMGNPGTLSSQLPLWMAGQAFTAQGIARASALCCHLTDPLLLTIAMP